MLSNMAVNFKKNDLCNAMTFKTKKTLQHKQLCILKVTFRQNVRAYCGKLGDSASLSHLPSLQSECSVNLKPPLLFSNCVFNWILITIPAP